MRVDRSTVNGKRRAVRATAAFALALAFSLGLFALRAGAAPGEGPDAPRAPAARPRPFRIQVVDDQTGRGVPLVELKTVHQVSYFTDSNGIVAFDEPGLLGTKVFFHVSSHGYEARKDGFGYRGKALETAPGGSATIEIHRANIAERLYRMTGAGIYRDSALTGDPVPTREPLLNGRVLGQDSVMNAVYQGKLYWLWGDTSRPEYPLGNFNMSGATSKLPGHGGLAPNIGVDLTYFVDEHGFSRPVAPVPGPGPTWISGPFVLKDGDGGERMFAPYAKVKPSMEAYQHGMLEFHDDTGRFEKIAQYPEPGEQYRGDYPTGHPILHTDHGTQYVYYAMPFPYLRLPADPEKLKDPRNIEAFTCLKPGTTREQKQLDRGLDGALRYGWKRDTQVLDQAAQNQLIASGQLKADEALLHMRDVETGKTVLAHGGSVYWNAYRRRWIMVFVESFGGPSFLGEVWYAEADGPLGPWVYARKIATHKKYSFYNPKQHPAFDQDGGRTIYFEGTYTMTFSGNDCPTPRYDYNQVMYRLRLGDPRLALPVAVYEIADGPGGARRLVTRAGLKTARAVAEARIAFFAPDRPGIANVPVLKRTGPDGREFLAVGAEGKGASDRPREEMPVFYVMADRSDQPARMAEKSKDKKSKGETPKGGNADGSPNLSLARLDEHTDESGGRTYTVEAPGASGHAEPGVRVLGRVWINPGRALPW